ncbi:MAG TPA: aminotransferase class III-fold pyridoxal phosphate-dependent enzyme [Steroidobacteraceae bacterium]|nr:aminotransferase class III-fold pyridoxal phosphate-dependent enzyme [Steroidobacteraceae bacterium]
MNTTDSTPRFNAPQARELVLEHFGLSVSARPLPSERDQNFALECASGAKLVLKIAKSDEDPAVLDFQNAALRHAHERLAVLAIPQVLPSKSGQEITRISDRAGRAYWLRLVSWLDGELLSAIGQRSPKLLASLGRCLAELDAALQDFHHPLMHRQLHWDLRHIGLALAHLDLLDAEQRGIVGHFRGLWESVPWQELRSSVIHGDINDNNVLARNGVVCGFIDFGDLVHSALIGDLAIAIAYAMLDQQDPLGVAAVVTAAYNERFPLSGPEIAALYPLVICRLCMSVCYAAWSGIVKKGDAYQTVHQDSAWRILRRLRAIPLEEAEAAIRAACGGTARLLAARRRLFGGSLSLSYRQPLNLVRGSMQYLYDQDGRRFLDGYNNVPHVGHCHPEVVRAAHTQMALLNTNTRYLSELAVRYAEELVTTLPGALKVCFLVNSGSEANELAIRLARSHTRQRDIIVLEQAYHGNTNTLVDLSPYKHVGPGGEGAPSWVHTAELPDLYRGRYKRQDPEAGGGYAQSVLRLLSDLHDAGRAPAAFIAESWPSVAGQMDLPADYLPAVYRAVRAAGGVCIADEVQTGYGRLGAHFWGFQAYGVEPDIAVLGKPIGNGHPLGAVVTTAEIAASFDNGMEFFSTFGGNTVSCAIGRAVLGVVLQEGLQAHARAIGDQLLAALRTLMARHAIIGDVRGSGLFLGVELVRDRHTLEPAAEEASIVVNRLREQGVLIGTEGPHENVLKIRPPMPFNQEDAGMLISALEDALRPLDSHARAESRAPASIRR